MAAESQCPRRLGEKFRRAVDVVGGTLPLPPTEFAERAYRHALNPLHNPIREVMLGYGGDVRKTPPMLGVFSDIPWHKLRESEVMAWAKAGFSWVVCDGEHSLQEGRYGREQMAMILRHGITPVQRLHREARSEHGDALTMGARATMMPYGTNVKQAEEYFKSVAYPTTGKATPLDRGGFPMRTGNYDLVFTPDELRAAEVETQGWIQFETSEYILEGPTSSGVLAAMEAQGSGNAVGFVGPFDAVMRSGPSDELSAAIDSLVSQAADRGLFMGRVCGSGSCSEPDKIEEAMVTAIKTGCRLICIHYATSDLPYIGAVQAAAPFWRAAEKCGF